MASLTGSVFRKPAFISKWTLWSHLFPFRSLLEPFNRFSKGPNFPRVNARQNREAVHLQALQNIGERSHGGQ
jgi:hypothetical protein